MKMVKWVALCCCLISCQVNEHGLIKQQYFIFGTVVDVLIWHNNPKEAETALLLVEQRLQNMHHQWHAWKPGRLSTINDALRSGEKVLLNNEELTFLLQTRALSKRSAHHFNPAMGELIHLWGFHTDEYPITEPPPDDQAIQALLENMPIMEDLIIEGSTMYSTNDNIWLDFGGIAKGYAIDAAIQILKAHGIHNAIVNAGGDLRSIGRKGRKDWKVAVRKPNSDEVLAVIEVDQDESIFTSGNYARYKTFDGQRYAHIIDPFTGHGVNQVVSATVIAEDGMLADAAATALIVAGTKNWQQIAKAMQLTQVLLLDAEGKCHATQKMMVRLQPTELQCSVTD